MQIQTCTALLLLALCGCTRSDPLPGAARPATPQGTATASTTVGGATLQTSSIAIADLNAAVATRYGIDRTREGVLLLVTVRDAAGNGIDTTGLALEATASSLTEAPQALPLRAIATDGMTDYIGAYYTAAPATVRFQLSATRGGSRADIATSAELYPR